MNDKPKIEGWRKMGIGVGAIAALTTFKATMDFKIAVIIGIVAIFGIAVQGVLDYVKKEISKTD
ncbi:hypothetical protein LCGC14_1628760 [marine sediment metagenome]|uniref:Uncharacterized protein n=1 Tax=marine sediment metagenome TaxID=412755 RepID=A0A0F9I3C0_9ZZZZ